MTKTQMLLVNNIIDMNEVSIVSIGKRIQDGKTVDFECEICRISSTDFIKLQQKHSVGKSTADVDMVPYFAEIIKLGCKDPNFKDLEFQKALGATSVKECLDKVLTPTEIAALASEIISFSGLSNAELEAAREETKN